MGLALPAGGPLTYDDLEEMPDDGRRYELVDGILIVTPAPAVPHQVVVAALYRVLRAARPSEVAVLTAPVDFVPEPTTVLEPDVLVFAADQAGAARLVDPPRLVAEVLSPGTRRYDLGTKRLAYAGARVPAYWIVDPVPPVELTVLHLVGEVYEEVARIRGDERYQAPAGLPFPVTVVPVTLLEL